MRLAPRTRKLALTAHVVLSVGWLGAVAGFLALAIAAMVSDDVGTVRGVHIAMEWTAWSVLLPLAIASLASGVAQALGTHWGLFRHYWVIVKLLMNVLATAVLLLYLPTLGHLADLADQASVSAAELRDLRSPSPMIHASGALLLLIAAVALSVYKPRGVTPYGWKRRQAAAR